MPRSTIARVSASSASSSGQRSRFERARQHVSPLVQDVEQPQKRRRIRRAHVRDVAAREREPQDHQVLEVVVGDADTFGGSTNRDRTAGGKRLVQVSRHRADVVAGVEPAFDGRAHDAQRLAGKRRRAGAILQVREQRLLGAMHAQRAGRDRDVLGLAGRAARLRVEQRRFRRQRRRAGAPLALDVRRAALVVLDRHSLRDTRRPSGCRRSRARRRTPSCDWRSGCSAARAPARARAARHARATGSQYRAAYASHPAAEHQLQHGVTG